MGRKLTLTLTVLAALSAQALAGCGSPTPDVQEVERPPPVAVLQPTAMPSPDIKATELALALAVESTLTALAPTNTPSPTHTQHSTLTPSPTPTIAPTQPMTYVVQAGDTLGRLARRFSTTIEAIAQANNITNVYLIEVNQVLVLPKGAETPRPMTPGAKATPGAMQARPTETTTASPPTAGISPEYGGAGANHWVAKNIDFGKLITLEDGSLWEIAPIDTMDTMLWLPADSVVVVASGWPLFPYKLVNTSQGDSAEAKYLGVVVVSSRIKGEFTGWHGDTVFVLSDGQIWQQASYAYWYHYAYWPEVIIVQASGGYKMVVEGVEGSIYVKRVK